MDMDNSRIDANLYNEKSLYLLNIRELRDMGRKLGVPSPTTMKKRDLVDYILNIVYGEVEPPVRNLYGRPNSRDFDMTKYLDKIKKNTDVEHKLKEARLYENSDIENFTLKAAAPKERSLMGEIEQRVEFIEDGRCELRVRQFIKSDIDIEVPMQYAKNLGLENFDVVEIIYSPRGIKLVSINGKKILEKIKPFKVCDENILAGSRKVFHIRTKEEIEKNINLTIENCNNQNLKLVYFGQEKTAEISNIAAEDCFVIDGEEDVRVRFKKFMMFVEYCKKQVFENKNIVIIIGEISDVENIINCLEYDIGERMKYNLNEDIKSFVRLGNVILTFKKIGVVKYF